jgi:AcrR family transcriptional regulator
VSGNGGTTVKAPAEKKEDRRIQRTRQLLLQALMSLVAEKGFDEVTVQDIIDRANIGRATFYAHFADKEDLLVQAMDPFSAHLKDRQRRALAAGGARDADAFAFAHELFAHAEGHRDVFRAIAGKRAAVILRRHFERMQLELVREEVKALAARSRRPTFPVEAVAHALASALFGLLVWWMDGRPRSSAEDASDLYRRMALASVRAALEAG